MLHGWCHVKCCRFGASSVYTIQPCTGLQCHFIQSHIGRVYVCLAVTCHLHFWQNVRDLLRATAVTRGWNGYRNKSQRRKLTLEKKILPPLLPALEPGTFRSRIRRSNHLRLSPAPNYRLCWQFLRIHVLITKMALRIFTGLSCFCRLIHPKESFGKDVSRVAKSEIWSC